MKKIISVILSLCFIVSSLALCAFTSAAATKIYGIDVSSYQGTIDWKAVKASGVSFAILRVGTSKGKDSAFERNYIGAKAAGVPIGVYFYSYASTVEKTKSEAATVLTWLSGKKFEYPIYYDIEDSSLLNGLTKADRTNLCIAYNTVLENAGYFCGVYSGKYWLNNYLDLATLRSKYVIWMAQYLNSGTDSKDYSSEYPIWQYSSKGAVSGISGNVDLDVCYYDYPSVIMRAGKNNYAKGSQPGDETLCGFYTSNNFALNMRTGPSTSYASVGTIPLNAEVAVVGFNDAATWANVVYNGVTAWSSLSYLTYKRAFPTLTLEYDGGVSSSVPASSKIEAFSSVTVPAPLSADGYDFDTWTLTRASDGKYYSGSAWTESATPLTSGTEITFDSSMFTSSASSETYTFRALWTEHRDRTGWYTVTTATSPLNIRSGAATSFAALGSAPKGSTVAIVGFNDDLTWAHVIYGDVDGWSSMGYLTYLKPFASYVVSYEAGALGSAFYPAVSVRPYDVVTLEGEGIDPESGFVAWKLSRASDGKTYSESGEWIDEGAGAPKLFAPSEIVKFDLSLISPDAPSEMFVFTAICEEVDNTLCGDANRDGEVSIKDSMTVKKFIIGTIDESAIDLTAADVDGDGDVTLKDMKEYKKYLLGIVEFFPREEMK